VSKEKLRPNMRKTKDERTKLKRHEQVRDKDKKKRGKNPISPRMKKRVEGRIEEEGKRRDTLLFNTSSQITSEEITCK